MDKAPLVAAKPICVNEMVSEQFPELSMRHQQDLPKLLPGHPLCLFTCGMADEPEQLGLESRDQETAAQDKALDQLTDHVRPLRLSSSNGIVRLFTAYVQVEEKELDANKVRNAMSGLAASQKADKEAQRLR